MTKITITKIGEIWCCADKAGCGECTSECRNYLHKYADRVSVEIDVCDYRDEFGICKNSKNRIYFGYGCCYDIDGTDNCRYFEAKHD